jgi:uncharacterized protein YjdB
MKMGKARIGGTQLRRALAFALALIMMLSLAPVSVFAATDITPRFTDAIFLARVRSALNKGAGDPIYEQDCASVTELHIESMLGEKIASLAGIEYFTNLAVLECGYNQLTSLDVSRNTELETLVCYANQLTSLDVSHNTKLEILSCDNNQLTSLDLSRNIKLETLYSGGNQLTSLDVSRNTELIHLDCTRNRLTSLDLSHNTKLEGLGCYSNQITSLDLSHNTVLQHLDCSRNRLTSLDITKNTILYSLEYGDNPITSIDISNNWSLGTAIGTTKPVWPIVTFKDWNGATLKRELVAHGSSASAPTVPARPGYTFTGWDKVFDSINEDRIITARYIPDTTIDAFVAVTNITGIPTSATAWTPLTLSGTITPSNATNKTITWSVKNAGATGATISGSTFKAATAGTATITATIANGKATGTAYTKDFTITVSDAFVYVTGIGGVPTSAALGTSLTLSGTVVPSNATNKTITWSVKNAGTTGATISGSAFKASKAGTATITATIANGTATGTAYTQDFTITVSDTVVAVTNITDVPTTATAGTSLALFGTVAPDNATNKTIAWSVKNAGETGATVGGSTFKATAAGTATITATIANGKATGTAYTKDFTVTVSKTFIAVTNISGVPETATVGTPLTLSGTVSIYATNRTITWSVKSAGTTGATISGSTFKAVAGGKAIVTATIADGKALGEPYTQDFEISVSIIAVTDISGLPTTAKAGTPLTLSGTIAPSNATHKTIAWNIKSPGTTGAKIIGSTFTATAAGTATITATIADGKAPGEAYTKDFAIIVSKPFVSDPFLMGEDNYKFINTERSFVPGETKYDVKLTDEEADAWNLPRGEYVWPEKFYPDPGFNPYKIPLERFEQLFSPVEAPSMWKSYGYWGGSCFGFAASSLLFNNEQLTERDYEGGVDVVNRFSTPNAKVSPLRDLIELYQISQYLEGVGTSWTGIYNAGKYNVNQGKQGVKALENALSKDGAVVISFCFIRTDGSRFEHAVVAYDGRFTDSGCVLRIYDSNDPNNPNARMTIDLEPFSVNLDWNNEAKNWASDGTNRSQPYISFMDLESFDKAVDSALAENDSSNTGSSSANSSGTYYLVIPNNGSVSATINGRPLNEVDGARDVTPVGAVPLEISDGTNTFTVYEEQPNRTWIIPAKDVQIGFAKDVSLGENQTIAIFDEKASFSASLDAANGNTEISAKAGADGYLAVAGDSAKTVTVTYFNDATVDKPAVVTATGSAINVSAAAGNQIKLSGNGTANVKIGDGAEKTIALQQTPETVDLGIGTTISLYIDSPYMSVNGIQQEIDPGRGTVATIRNSRTMLPIRAIAEALGGTVDWNNSEQKVTLQLGSQSVEMVIGNRDITVNGVRKTMDVAPYIENSRTFLPIRFVSENLGASVEWINESRQVVVTYLKA